MSPVLAGYTPGPWTKAERLNGPWWHISSEHGLSGKLGQGRQAVACVHGESRRGAKAYAAMFEANAHLIAAAPELLEAVAAIIAWDESEKAARPYEEDDGAAWRARLGACMLAFELAKAAYAKASPVAAQGAAT